MVNGTAIPEPLRLVPLRQIGTFLGSSRNLTEQNDSRDHRDQ
jgi:hypothetical protein